GDGQGGSVTTRPGEDEVQGGEHVEIPQGLDHLVTARSGVTPPPPAVQTQHALDPGIGAPAAVAGDEGGEETDLLASSVLDHVLVLEGYRPFPSEDQVGGASSGLDPPREFVGVGDRKSTRLN